MMFQSSRVAKLCAMLLLSAAIQPCFAGIWHKALFVYNAPLGSAPGSFDLKMEDGTLIKVYLVAGPGNPELEVFRERMKMWLTPERMAAGERNGQFVYAVKTFHKDTGRQDVNVKFQDRFHRMVDDQSLGRGSYLPGVGQELK